MKVVVLVVAAAFALTACGEKKTAEQKVQAIAQGDAGIYPLKPDEAQRALNNAKQYFEKQWAFADNARGQVQLCRPTDSNANGLVTCVGQVPVKATDGKILPQNQTVYCSYRPELTGCNNEDSVPK